MCPAQEEPLEETPQEPADESPPETPLEELALGVAPAPRGEAPPDEDAGMGALEPAYDLAQDEAFPPEAEDAGLQAYEPVLMDEEFPEVQPAAAELTPPPQEAMRGAPIFSPAAFAEPSPDEGTKRPDMPEPETRREADPEMVAFFVTDERMNALWQRADTVQAEVPKKIQNLYLARQLLDAIQSARNALMAGREYFEEAERYVNEVDYRLAFGERLKAWSSSWGSLLFLYEVVWALVFVWGMFRLGDAAFAPAGSPFLYILSSMVWGGIGGVTGALLALIRHITKYQDFDIQHRMWYLGSPIMGVVVGLFMYGAIQVGLLSLTNNGSINSPFIIYVLAWLGGYQHNVFTDIVKRVIKAFEIAGGASEQQSASGEGASGNTPKG